MRASFPTHYAPTSADFQTLWSSGLICLDTNVLLGLYRLPETAREELLAVLEGVKDRLWIPHHVGVEFQRRRVDVIMAARREIEAALTKAQEHLSATDEMVRGLELEKSSLELDPERLLADVAATNTRVVDAVKKMQESLVDVASSDPIRDRIDELLPPGSVGPAASSQEEVDNLVADGERRYEAKVPPGFRDAHKEKDPERASFLFGGLRYESKFGDLILWRQLLAEVTTRDLAGVLLVTSDRKEDWWWIEHGRTLGPHPELVHEMRAQGGVDLFWMYSAASFAEDAGNYIQSAVSQRTVGEIDAAETRERDRQTALVAMPDRLLSSQLAREQILRAEQAVEHWVFQSYRGARPSSRRGFVDFLVGGDPGPGAVGISVKAVTNSRSLRMRLDDLFSRAYLEIAEGRLAEVILIVAIAPPPYEESHQMGAQIEHAVVAIERTISRLRDSMSAQPIQVLLGIADFDGFSVVNGWGPPLP